MVEVVINGKTTLFYHTVSWFSQKHILVSIRNSKKDVLSCFSFEQSEKIVINCKNILKYSDNDNEMRIFEDRCDECANGRTENIVDSHSKNKQENTCTLYNKTI